MSAQVVRMKFNDLTKYQQELYVAKVFMCKDKNARRRGIENKLTLTTIKKLLKSDTCYFLGIPLFLDLIIDEDNNYLSGTAEQEEDSFSIDRIDPRKGYVSGNVVACSFKANQLKEKYEHSLFSNEIDDDIRVLTTILASGKFKLKK